MFRCVPVEVILGMFESEVDEWIGKVRRYMDMVKVNVDEKWLKSEDRIDMIRLIDT